MEPAQPSWGEVLSVTWLVLWRTALGNSVLLAVVVFAFRRALGADPLLARQDASLLAVGAFFVLSFAWQAVVIRAALRKRYRRFTLALLRR